jgi:hypothetical protein
MAEGDSRSEEFREEDEKQRRITHEPWLIKFLRKVREPLVYGFRENPISEEDMRENDPLEETPEEQIRRLEEEKRDVGSDI